MISALIYSHPPLCEQTLGGNIPQSRVYPVVVVVCKRSGQHHFGVLEPDKLMGPYILSFERSVERLYVSVLFWRVLPDEPVPDPQCFHCSQENIEQQAFRVIGAVISAGYSLGVAILLLFPILYLILKRKNIPRRPYFILAIAGSLIYFGITGLTSFLQSWVTPSPVIDHSQPYILDQLVISLMMPIIELSIGGILLCRSSVIRKSIKK